MRQKRQACLWESRPAGPSLAQNSFSMAKSMPKQGAEVVALHNIALSYWWGAFSFSLLTSSTPKTKGPTCQNTEIIQVSTFSLPLRLNGFAIHLNLKIQNSTGNCERKVQS